MPSEAFPTRGRATAHGISAAMGKVGATAGSIGLLNMWYKYCKSSVDSTGQPNCSLSNSLQSEIDAGIIDVMWVCAGVSAAGMLFTLLFCRETGGKSLEEVDASSKVLAAHDNDVEARHAAEAAAALENGSAPAAAADVPEKTTTKAVELVAGTPSKVELLSRGASSDSADGPAVAPLVIDTEGAAGLPASGLVTSASAATAASSDPAAVNGGSAAQSAEASPSNAGGAPTVA